MSEKKSVHRRFWEQVWQGDAKRAPGCWIWMGGENEHGYGKFTETCNGKRKQHLAHRFAYEQIKGPIPEGKVLDHLCRRRHCVNPSHTEPVLQKVNNARGLSLSAQNLLKTQCIRGHPFAGDNLYLTPKGTRKCRACHALESLRYYHANKEKEQKKNRCWREKNQDRVKAYRREAYRANAEKVKESVRQYQEKNKEKIKARRDEYYRLNRERLITEMRQRHFVRKQKRLHGQQATT